MYWFLGRNSELSIQNKLLLYKQIIKPVWTYGIQLWGCTKKSNIKIIQIFKNKILRIIVNALWYIRNEKIHRELKVPSVEDEIRTFASKYQKRLKKHQNGKELLLLDNNGLTRRLKRLKPFGLVHVPNASA